MAALDPQAQEILNHYSTLGVPAIETLSPQQARNVPLLDYAARDFIASKVAARLLTIASPSQEQGVAITHLSIPSPDGGLLLRVYTPLSDRAPFPVLVYFHGGGWVIGNLDTYDASARALC